MTVQPSFSKTGLSGHRRLLAVLASAFLFGAGTPLAKGLLEHVSPWLLAGLLCLGSGLGLGRYRLHRSDTGWLAAAASLMARGSWLHLTEHPAHARQHEVLEHTRLHWHDQQH